MTSVPRPTVERDDDAEHLRWAIWSEDNNGETAHLGFWAIDDGRIVLKSIVANADVRGRAMLRWLARIGRPIHVVEVIAGAIPFWERMLSEGTISSWEPSDGFASPLERRAVPIPGILLS